MYKNFLKSIYYSSCDGYLNFFHKGLISKNSLLKNQYENQRIFFLLTGSSINHIDIPRLKGQFTFGLSFIFLNADINSIPLTFYSCLEPWRGYGKIEGNWPQKFLPTQGKKNKRKIYYNKIKEKYLNSNTITFMNANNLYYLKKNGIINQSRDNIYFIRLKDDIKNLGHPDLELTKRINSGPGSFHHAIMTMIYMGFKEIYLCGAGYTYKPMYHFHFYDNFDFPKEIGKERAAQAIKKEIINQYGKDGVIDYYGLLDDGDLFRGICVRKEKEYPKIFSESHIKINKYAKSQGVKIINIIPDNFESPFFQSVSWDHVVNNIL